MERVAPMRTRELAEEGMTLIVEEVTVPETEDLASLG